MKSPSGRPSPAAGQKRRKTGASGSRVRKKQKRLDAICDRLETPLGTPFPYRNPAAEAPAKADEPGTLRRSTRTRRAPVVLDASPPPSNKRRGNRGRRGAQASGGSGRKASGRGRSDVAAVDEKVKREIKFEEEAKKPVDARGFSEEDVSDWSSRLRSRVRKGGVRSSSAAGKGKPSYRQPGELVREVKDYSKAEEEAMEKVGSVAQSGRKERRRRKKKRRRRLQERDGAPVLPDVKKEEDSHDKALAEEVVFDTVLSSSHKDGGKGIPGGEVGAANKVCLGDKRKVVGENMFPEDNDGITYEEVSPQGESKVTARGGISDDGRDAKDKASSEGNNRVDQTEAPKSKIAASGHASEDRRVRDEKTLSDGQSKITHEEVASQAEGKIAFMWDMLQDRRAASEKDYSETGNIDRTSKASSEYEKEIPAEKGLQKHNGKTTEEDLLEEDSRTLAGKTSVDSESTIAAISALDTECEHHMTLESADQEDREEEVKCVDEKTGNSDHVEGENMVNVCHQSGNGVTGQCMGVCIDKLERRVSEGLNILKQENSTQVHQVDIHVRPRVKEGRRCGLCGGSSDGKPPKKLILETADSDNEHYNGSSSSEEPNYDLWDGFGDEPEWLGRLLGPIRDRFGIARVWVHQQCAVWSPEVYFAGLGCLKSVRAALCRGRALKCSRCGRPGATIGCRVDRCPKTYHLPCARAENCIFDHRKFLIACTDHRHIFQPQGNRYSTQIRKMKNRKMRLDMRKLSNETCRKDLEAEEKWLENCGEDEEFLKRESKRLHRDLLRVTPVYIGGSCSGKDKTYEGWESVAGLQDVIQCMKEVIILPLLYPEFFNSLGLTPPRGVLLHGYPGTGKTLVVRALIGECARGDKRIAYFARKGADCLGKYVGDAERQLRLLFQVAERCQPSIIFFDEIDGLAPCRSKQQDQTHNSVVSTLLSLLDGVKSRGSVVVIGATNRPDAVDPALRRPGRFDREIYFPLPSVKDRSAILSLQTKNWPKPLSGRALSWIANQTAGYAGADLQALCTQAAMIALKRNCPLHEILISAEKGSSNNRQPSLPVFTVEEKDWLAALACAPPPCSRREAGMAANGVVTAPLPTHLVPCLLQPLSYILMSFCFDERIWIPPALLKASKSIRDVISSALQLMNLPIRSWESYLHELIKKSNIAKEIERNLSCVGLLSSASPLGPSCTPDNDNDDEHDKFTSQGSQIPRSCIHSFTSPNASVGLEKQSGFRVLIAGAPRCGQQHLAACLLHQFLGRIEIQKVNPATISQEGHGDIIRGITQIILKCVSMGRCVVYMPRIDLWAVDEDQQDGGESTCYKTFKSSKREDVDDVAKHSSQAWDCFVAQLDSLSRSSSLIILATCEMENHDLPVRIREFFMSSLLKNTDSASSECTIPRFAVQVTGNFEYCLIISSAVTRISRDIVEQYVQFIHERSHEEFFHKREATAVGKSEETDKICPTMDSERTSSNHGASLSDGHAQEAVGDDKRQNLIDQINQEKVQRQLDSLSRVPSNRITKGNSMFMIATLGYQILQYPQFADLCWVTSKLKEGPCADISGPWTVWPFNSCIVDANKSTDKATCPLNPSNVKDKENSCLVRGLVAVGLLAYRGAYTSVREVSSEVRKVLELLVKLISVRIQDGKDKYRFVRLLSQVAHLDDMVNSWAYMFQSLQIDNRCQASGSNSRPMISGEVGENNDANSCKLPANGASMSNNCDQSCDAIQEMMQIKKDCAKENGECSDPSNYIVLESEAPDDVLSSSPSLVSCPDSSHTLLREETCRSENPGPCFSPFKGLKLPEGQTGLSMIEDTLFVANLHNAGRTMSPKCGSAGVRELCDGLGAVNSSTSDRLAMNEQVGDTKSEYKGNGNSLSFSEPLCLYSVCSDCLQSVHVVTQEILTHYLKASGHSPTLDDVHEIVTTCSLNLVAVIRKHFFSQSCYKAEGCCSRGQESLAEDCVSQDVNDIQLKKISESPRQFEHIKFFPNECGQHQRDREVFLTREKGYDNSPIRPELKFLFKDGILMPSNPQEDVVLHCSFERLSIQTIIEMLSSTKERYV